MKDNMLNYIKRLMKLSVPQLTNIAYYLFNNKFNRSRTCLNYDPINISVVVTGECTFKCKMCLTHSPINSEGFLNGQNPCDMISFEYFKKVIDQFKAAINLQLIGAGEPFLNPDLFKMIEYAATTRRMEVHLVSNGSIIHDKVDHILNSSLSTLCISINGEDRNEFERMTGNDPKEYDKVLVNICNLTKRKQKLRANTKICLSFIIDRFNYIKIPDMIKLSEDLEVDVVYLINFMPLPYVGFTPEERCLFIEDDEVLHTLIKYKNSLKSKLTIQYPTLLSKNNLQPYCCDTFFNQIRIDGSGHYGSCSIMLLNNKRGDDFLQGKQSFNSPYFQKMRLLFIEQKKMELDDSCQYCTRNVGINIPD